LLLVRGKTFSFFGVTALVVLTTLNKFIYIFPMSPVLTIDLLHTLNEKLGKEEAKRLAEAIEIGFEDIEKRAEEIALQKRLELKDELTKELATKADILLLRGELFGETKLIRQEMQAIKVELEGKITRLEQKFTFLIVLNIIALTLMNPVAAEIIKGLLRL